MSTIPRYIPHNVSPFLSLTDPLTPSSLLAIRETLRTTRSPPVNHTEKHAAVLLPLCNVNGRPGVLLEVRGKLRTHSGEVRCDPSAQDAYSSLTDT